MVVLYAFPHTSMDEEKSDFWMVEEKVQDFLVKSDLSLEQVELALKRIKQKQNVNDKTQTDLKGTLELDKADIVHLILGTVPSSLFFEELESRWYWRLNGWTVDKWMWNTLILKETSVQELIKIYQKIKKQASTL